MKTLKMSLKIIQKWLAEFKTIRTNGYNQYAAQVLQNKQLIDELYNIFDSDEFPPEVIDPICHQLFSFYRSQNVGLQRFTLEFIPLLLRIRLLTTGYDVDNKKKFGGIDACLLGIYNVEAAKRNRESKVKKFTIPVISRPSVYHEPPSLSSVLLTENALRHHRSDKELCISNGPVPQADCFNSQNRLSILTYILNCYNAHITFVSPKSHGMLCKLFSKLSKRGFDSLVSVTSLSSGGPQHNGATILDEPRIPLSSGCLIEMLSTVYFTMFNGSRRVGLETLKDIQFRASYELYSDVLLIVNAIRNSLQLDPSGQFMDGPMGLSVMLSPVQGNPVFAKDAITNASFRAKKLPDDIDVQGAAGQSETLFRDDGSDDGIFITIRTPGPTEKSKSSPLPKVGKGPIMKKKEDKTKDHAKPKESSAGVASLTASIGRKGSHLKKSKSPEHSVIVSSGPSESANADPGSISVNATHSSSGNSRSVFEMNDGSTARDAGRASLRTSNYESTSFKDDVVYSFQNGSSSKVLGQQVRHSKMLNGSSSIAANNDELESWEDDDNIHTKF